MRRTILTMAEVSEMISVPMATLRYWRHNNDRLGPRSARLAPRSFLLGGRVVYDEAAVQSWIDEQRRDDEQRRVGAA